MLQTTEASYEPDFDTEVVNACIERLIKAFKSLDQVDERHPAVTEILTYSGYASWSEYVQDHDLTDSFPVQQARDTDQTTAKRVALYQKQLAAQDAAFKASDETVKKIEADLQKMAAVRAEMSTVATLTAYAYEADDKAKNAAATQTLTKIDLQMPVLQKTLRIERNKRKTLIVKMDALKAKIEAARENVLQVNTSDPTINAEVYAKIAANSIWKLATLENAITEMRLSLEGDTGDRRFDFRELSSAGGGVYDSQIERLDNLETARKQQLTLYAAAELGYESESEYRNSDRWWPDFPDLHKGIMEAQNRIAANAVKRAQNRQQAVVRARDEGYC